MAASRYSGNGIQEQLIYCPTQKQVIPLASFDKSNLTVNSPATEKPSSYYCFDCKRVFDHIDEFNFHCQKLGHPKTLVNNNNNVCKAVDHNTKIQQFPLQQLPHSKLQFKSATDREYTHINRIPSGIQLHANDANDRALSLSTWSSKSASTSSPTLSHSSSPQSISPSQNSSPSSYLTGRYATATSTQANKVVSTNDRYNIRALNEHSNGMSRKSNPPPPFLPVTTTSGEPLIYNKNTLTVISQNHNQNKKDNIQRDYWLDKLVLDNSSSNLLSSSFTDSLSLSRSSSISFDTTAGIPSPHPYSHSQSQDNMKHTWSQVTGQSDVSDSHMSKSVEFSLFATSAVAAATESTINSGLPFLLPSSLSKTSENQQDSSSSLFLSSHSFRQQKW